MLEFGSGETFGKPSTSVRMDRAMRIRADRKCQVHQPLGSSVKGTGLADRRAELLNRGPHIRVLTCYAVWSWRQTDRGILGQISRR